MAKFVEGQQRQAESLLHLGQGLPAGSVGGRAQGQQHGQGGEEDVLPLPGAAGLEQLDTEVHGGSGGLLRHRGGHRDFRSGDLRHQVPGLEPGRTPAAGQGQCQGETEQGYPFLHGSFLLLRFYSYRRKGRGDVPRRAAKKDGTRHSCAASRSLCPKTGL